jgi:hypothetical protein
MTAISGESLYTAASSEVSIPISKFLSLTLGRQLSTCDRASGPILAAHPEASVICVSFILFIVPHPPFPSDYNIFIHYDKG